MRMPRTLAPSILTSLLVALAAVLVLSATPRAASAQPVADASAPIAAGEIIVRFRDDAPPGFVRETLVDLAAGAEIFGAPITFDSSGEDSGAPAQARAFEARQVAQLEAWRAPVPVGAERAAVAALQHNPWVLYAEPNYVVHGTFTPDDPDYSDPNLVYAPQIIEADLAWDQTLGVTDVVVAILDSGISAAHEDFDSARVRAGYDFVNDDNDPADDHGHGTHVAGIAAAATDNTTGMAGIAQSDILPVKVLDQNLAGTWADVAAGITWAVDNDADVINLSLGGSSGSQLLVDALDHALANDVLVVASAGNGATSNPFYPAYYTHTLAVAATNQSDTRWSLSNYGSWVDLSAPGASIWSTDWTSGNPDTGYTSRSGTSQSAPHVTGVAALILAADDTLTRDEVADILTTTADDLGTAGWDQFYGHGRINADAAVAEALGNPPTATPTPTTPPTVTPTPTSAPYEQRAHAAGSSAYTDGNGKVWDADQPYSGNAWGHASGTTRFNSAGVSGTSDDPLYQHYRETPADYRFDVDNGDYEVTLRFAEFDVSKAGRRKMQIVIEGTVVESALDIYAQAGRYAALDRSYTTTVNDGQLLVAFSKNGGREQPIVSAIEVRALGGGTPPSATPTSAPPTATSTSAPPTATQLPSPTPSGGGSETHSGDLDGTSSSVGGGKWRAQVTITVHDDAEAAVANATVQVTWSGGVSGSASCVTSGNGTCTVTSPNIRNREGSVTLTIDNITHATLSYDNTANHDPDGDSNGTTISVGKP